MSQLEVAPEFGAELKITRGALSVHAEHPADWECVPDPGQDGMCHRVERVTGVARRPQ